MQNLIHNFFGGRGDSRDEAPPTDTEPAKPSVLLALEKLGVGESDPYEFLLHRMLTYHSHILPVIPGLSPFEVFQQSRGQLGYLMLTIEHSFARYFSPNDTVRAFNPGIGGGEGPIDPLGAFFQMDADVVLGADLLFSIKDPVSELPGIVAKRFELQSEMYRVSLESLDVQKIDTGNEPYLAWDFYFQGRRRELRILKEPTDAMQYIPPSEFCHCVYTSLTGTLFSGLPTMVLDSLGFAVVRGQIVDTAVQNARFWVTQGLGICITPQEIEEFFRPYQLTGTVNPRVRLLIKN